MKARYIIGGAFILSGVILQMFAVKSAEGTLLKGAGAGLFIMGVMVEIIGYASDGSNKK